jgi:hypothetical protein
VTAAVLGLVLAVARRGARTGPDRMTPAPDAEARQVPAVPPSGQP